MHSWVRLSFLILLLPGKQLLSSGEHREVGQLAAQSAHGQHCDLPPGAWALVVPQTCSASEGLDVQGRAFLADAHYSW